MVRNGWLMVVLGGLMSFGKEVQTTGATSYLLLDTISLPITCSLLLSVSAGQSSRPSLYSIEIQRSIGVTSSPNIYIKVLSGSYSMKLAQKTDNSGRFCLYIKRTANTPVIWVKILTAFGVGKGLLMTEATEDELQDAIEIEAT